MKYTLSIEESPSVFANKTNYFEKRFILQHYFANKIAINSKEREILEKCPAQEPETISLIGFLLADKTPINIFRLRIGSVFKSDKSLANCCKALLTDQDVKDAEEVIFHWEFEEDKNIELPITDLYCNLFKS